MCDHRTMQTHCHCCWCVTGVFCTLLGIILLSTGVCMILDYGAFDVSTLPPGWQSSDGQRNLGIILTCVAMAILIVGVLVSILFFTVCNRTTAEPLHASGHLSNGSKNPVPQEVLPNEKSQQASDTSTKPKQRSHRHHSKSKSKHGVKKSRKRLETHLEDPEEPDWMHLRELKSAGKQPTEAASVPREKRTNFLSPTKINEDNFQIRKPRNGVVENGDSRPEIGIHTPLPPLLNIAPANVTTCNITDETAGDTAEPEVFRIDGTSISSEDSSSSPASGNGVVENGDSRPEIDIRTPLPPLLNIAPANVTTCNITDETTVDTAEPEVFRIDGTSISSEDSSSTPASSRTGMSDTNRTEHAWENPREQTIGQRQQLDRELSGIGLLR